MKKNKKVSLLLFLFLSAFTCFLLIFFHLDADYFWHIKVGEYMFHHGPITYNPFTWIVSHGYWVSHEWLFEIILFFLKIIFGNYHALIYSSLCIFLLLILLFYINRENLFKNIPFSVFWILFFCLLFLGYIQARPHLISFSLFAISFYFLYDLYKNENSKKVYFLPIITVVWANIHGGSSNLPYLLCMIYVVIGSISFKFKKIESKRITSKQLKKYILVMILCLFSICVNIHGFLMLLYPYQNMSDSTMLSNINEWMPTSFQYPFHYVYYLYLLFVFMIMIFSDKKIVLIDLFLFLFFTYLGLKSIRFWIYTYIAMNYIIYYYVKPYKFRKYFYSFFFLIVTFFCLSFIFNFKNIFSIQYSGVLDNKMISYIKKEKPRHLFNMYDLGGELIYYNIPVFIDGRADFYSKFNYQDYLDIVFLKNSYLKKIQKYDFDYFLIYDNYPLKYYLDNNDYTLVNKRHNILLYKKNS